MMDVGPDVEDMLEREVKAFGTSCHIVLPRRYLGRKVKILVLSNRFFK